MFKRIIGGLFACYILIFIAMLYFKNDKLYFFKHIDKRSDTPEKLFRHHSFYGYIYGVVIFSTIITILLSAVIDYLIYGVFGIRIELLNALNLFYFVSTIFTILWIMYLVSFDIVSIAKAKVIVTFWIAFMGTISIVVIIKLSYFEQIFKSIIAYQGIAYIWLQYFLEKMEYDEKKDKK
ncbi:hypothetical protein [Clostridium ljungdahlii]|uniref:hypothetical protein n=1 Tax=Clostridium ljungdahlii TaxID=1538 RepID=UPI003868A9DE